MEPLPRFSLYAEALGAVCACLQRPELQVLRGQRMPVNNGDFCMSVTAAPRGSADGPCPFRNAADEGDESKLDQSWVTTQDLVGMTPAEVLFDMTNWGELVFRWPARPECTEACEDAVEDLGGAVEVPRVYFSATSTTTAAELRRALHDTILPDVRDQRLEGPTEFVQLFVSADEYAAQVADSVEALAAAIDAYGGTFGCATIPGAHDTIVDGLVYHRTGNCSTAVFGTEHWWYDMGVATS
jgi:hypothetical protein